MALTESEELELLELEEEEAKAKAQPQPAAQPEKRGVLGTVGAALKPFAEIPGELGKGVESAAQRYVQMQREGAPWVTNAPAALANATIGNAFGAGLGAVGKSVLSTANESEKKMFNRLGQGAGKIAGPVMQGYEKNTPAVVKNLVDIAGAEVGGGIGKGAAKSAIETGGKLAVGAAEKIPAAIDVTAGKVTSALSGVPEQALRTAGTKGGRAALQAASGQQFNIGQKLVDMVDNFETVIPERKIIDEAVANMPSIKPDNLILTLEAAKTPKPIGAAKGANQSIDNLITDIKDHAANGALSAADMLSFRRQIDDMAKAAFGTDSKSTFDKASLSARTTIKNDLIAAAQASGNPQYVEAMKTWSDKIEKLDHLKKYLGSNPATREGRAQGFISTLFGKNNTDRVNALKDFQDIFGTDLLSEAKMTQMASQLGEGGKATIFPVHTTGRSILGAATGGAIAAPIAGTPLGLLAAPAGLAASSPLVASRTILPATQGLRRFGQGLGDLGKKPIAPGAIKKPSWYNERGAIGGTAQQPIHSENFKQWFGDWEKAPEQASKVVDESGKPLVVYHGTNKDFNEFNGSAFFTEDASLASVHSKGASRLPDLSTGANVKPVYLNIKNPAYQKDVSKAILDGIDPKDIKKYLVSKGYDGIIKQDEIIVFSPNQIKSTIGNSGAFSPKNPDIRGSGALPMLAGTAAAGLGGSALYHLGTRNKK